VTEGTTIRYQFRTGTVEDLARSLIVASSFIPDDETIKVPLTGATARHLGLVLEYASQVNAANAAATALCEARSKAAAEAEASAVAALVAARGERRRCLWLCIASLVWCCVSLAAWWLT
jgi:hypothetical protein